MDTGSSLSPLVTSLITAAITVFLGLPFILFQQDLRAFLIGRWRRISMRFAQWRLSRHINQLALPLLRRVSVAEDETISLDGLAYNQVGIRSADNWYNCSQQFSVHTTLTFTDGLLKATLEHLIQVGHLESYRVVPNPAGPGESLGRVFFHITESGQKQLSRSSERQIGYVVPAIRRRLQDMESRTGLSS